MSPSRRRRQSRIRGRLTVVMGLLGAAFILVTFGYIAWEQRNRLIQRNEDDIKSHAFFLADHTARLLEVTDLTLRQTVGQMGETDWNRVEQSRQLWERLSAIKEALPYIDNVWLNDSTGRLRLTTAGFPTPPSNVSGRDAFTAQVPSDQGLFVGAPIIGRVTREPTFMISRRLQDRNEAFDGIISVTVALSYFGDYWGKLRLPRDGRIVLIRAADAKVIAQYPPPADGLSFAPIDKLALDRALEANPGSGVYSFVSAGDDRLGVYHRVGDLPLYIGVSMPEDAYWSPWILQMRLYGAFALIALLALLALTALAAQQFQEEAANAALLERQVALRTGELRTETAALETLNHIGSALAGELEIERIIESVVDAGVALTGARIGAFYAAGEGAGISLQYSHNAMGAQELATALLVSETVIPALAEGRTIRVDDISDARAGAHGATDDEWLQGRIPDQSLTVRSVLAVPVRSRTGETYGVLLFGHDRSGMFAQRAERLVGGLAAQAAIALENGRLYQDAQREIEERKQAQTQQSLLIRELHHRVKNTLATVQAVVGATARSTSNIDEFYRAFVGRIISLANTHSLLTEAVWQTASLREILEKELLPYNDDGDRITLDGPAVELPSEAAVPLGMAVHELTTNAAKYGALSVSSGRVIVAWTSEAVPDGVRVALSWREEGGPKVAQPQRQGFGSRLLHRVLTTQLNAKVEMDFDPAGLTVSIETILRKGDLLNPVL